ncbi:MAG: lipid-A-disaccharide synthase [Hyphomicrobiaceae bacterium]|nr:MAG: lipid-A-disaccharide synthase [Hyphomicrobiaceae bacterium]
MKERTIPAEGQDLRLFLVAGEHSGDALGGKLMAALNLRRRGRIRYLGVGGAEMAAQGLVSQFPIDDVAVMGISAIVGRLPRILRRVYGTVAAAVVAEPDAVVIIDSPEFTHPIARRIRAKLPDTPIIDYVSPSVWAWRPGRARKMREYVDHVLALLPFEPDAHARLGGPPCTYVGHPLIERVPWLGALDTGPLAERLALPPGRSLLLVLPGSRPSEVKRLMKPFGEALTRLIERGRSFEVAIPVVPSVRALVEERLPSWPVRPHLLEGEEDKFRAFKLARAALAASGTVTLELALAGTPMVVAYKVDAVMAPALRLMITAPSAVLANLVLGEKVFPEFHQEDCTGLKLANALAPLLGESPARDRQLAALARVPERLRLPKGTPSEAAADIVLHYAESGRGWPHPELLKAEA